MKGITMELTNEVAVGEEFTWVWSFETEDGGVPKSRVVLTGRAWELGDDMIYEIENCKTGAVYLKSRSEFRKSAVVGNDIEVEKGEW